MTYQSAGFAFQGTGLFAFQEIAGDAPPVVVHWPPPAGRGNKNKNRRRYMLPDGQHVYATVAEAEYLAEQLSIPEEEITQPLRQVRRNRVVKTQPSQQISLAEMPSQSQPQPNLMRQTLIENTKYAPLEDIEYEKVLEKIRRKRRALMLLLLS